MRHPKIVLGIQDKSNFKKTNTSPEFSQEVASYDTLIKLTSHFWSRDILSIRDCLMEPFLNLPSNF